jgi:hypothetical protein
MLKETIYSQRGVFDLSLDHVHKLDKKMRRCYGDWAAGLWNLEDNEPAQEDLLFIKNQPLTISYRYGQNSQLGLLLPEEEAEAFERGRDMKNIRFFSFSMAAHIV